MKDNDGMRMVSEATYEIAIGSLQAQCKWWFIICLVLIAALIFTNAGWIVYEAQFSEDVTTVTQDVDTGTGNAVITGVGDIYGENTSDRDKKDTR